MRRTVTTLLVAVLALFAAVPAAHASTRSKIIADCSDDGVLQGTYTAAQLRDARKHLPSDVAEYSDCADILRASGVEPDTGFLKGFVMLTTNRLLDVVAVYTAGPGRAAAGAVPATSGARAGEFPRRTAAQPALPRSGDGLRRSAPGRSPRRGRRRRLRR